MTRYLGVIGIIAVAYITYLLMKNIDNKRTKSLILIVPIIVGSILYISIILMTKKMSPYACDGAALMGIFTSFILFGMGILFNLINILYFIFTSNK